MQHKINTPIFNFQGYLVDICYDDYTHLYKFYKTTIPNKEELYAKVKTDTNTLVNCEPYYYIDATEIYEIDDSDYLKFAQNRLNEDTTLELPNYFLYGENFKFTLPTKEENIPSNVVLVKKITQHLPMLLTQNNDTDEKVVRTLIELLTQLLPPKSPITLKQTYTQFGEVEEKDFSIDEAIKFVEDKERVPLFIYKNGFPCGVFLSTMEYHHMEHCTNIVEDREIFESIKERLVNHPKGATYDKK